MKAYIFVFRFYNYDANRPNIGGTQTYATELSELLYSQGYDVHILDEKKGKCKSPKFGKFKHFTVEEFYYGCNLNKAFHKFYKDHTDNKTLFIIGDDEQDIYPKKIKNLISIQHGIGWDSVRNGGKKSLPIIFPLYKLGRCVSKLRKFIGGANYVCVDYNYFNWLRTLYDIPKDRILCVIPNFSSGKLSSLDIEEKLNSLKDLKNANIVFARRLQWYRGPIMWANVVKRLSKEYPSLRFTIAGEGACENEVHHILKDVKNVTYTKFNAEDSIQFHSPFNIAVVPTIFSEGTSLSACEAMASGCVPVVSHVGGLTNIILDHFNGRLFYPQEEYLYKTMQEVIEMDINEFKRVAKRAYETATSTFSRDTWAEKWITMINLVMSSK